MKLFLYSLLSLTACALLGYHGWKELERWGESEVVLTQKKDVTLAPGTSLTTFATQLETRGVVSSGLLFRIWVRTHSDYTRFQAGRYLFEKPQTPQAIARKVSAGDIFVPVLLEYTIPEGFTLEQVRKRLVAKGVGSEEDFLRIVRDREFIQGLGVDGGSLEGFLYPATYQFSTFPTPKEALERAVKTFFDHLPPTYSHEVKALGLTLAEAVSFASLIERETAHEDEREKVSEVIWRRLRKNAPLGIDAAIIYGIKDYQGDIKRRHLEDSSNLYNTRIHKGLPPTAIGAPSRASLLAILSPTDEGYYYYVLDVDQEGGRHHFSKTIREHNKYVRKLVKHGR